MNKDIKLSTLSFVTSQNGQAHFENVAAFAARFLECICPFWDVVQKKIKSYFDLYRSIFYLQNIISAIIVYFELGHVYVYFIINPVIDAIGL